MIAARVVPTATRILKRGKPKGKYPPVYQAAEERANTRRKTKGYDMDYKLELALYRRAIDLNHKEVAVLFALGGAAKNSDTLPSPAIKRLADRAGMAIGTVKDTIKTLSEKRIITVSKRKTASGQNCNVYTVNISALGKEEVVSESGERVQTCEPSRVQTCEPLKSSPRVQESSKGVHKSSICGHYNNIDNNINNNNNKTRQRLCSRGGLGGTNQPPRSVCPVEVDYSKVWDDARSRLMQELGMTEDEADRRIKAVEPEFSALNDSWRQAGWIANGKKINNPQSFLTGTLFTKAKEYTPQTVKVNPRDKDGILKEVAKHYKAVYPKHSNLIEGWIEDAPDWVEKTINGHMDDGWGGRDPVKCAIGIYRAIMADNARNTEEQQYNAAIDYKVRMRKNVAAKKWVLKTHHDHGATPAAFKAAEVALEEAETKLAEAEQEVMRLKQERSAS